MVHSAKFPDLAARALDFGAKAPDFGAKAADIGAKKHPDVGDSFRDSFARTCRRHLSFNNFSRAHNFSRGPPPQDSDPVVACGGGGIFVFWQLGAARALVEHRSRIAANSSPRHAAAPRPAAPADLRWAGSSAGSICAALTICGIDPETAIRKADEVATGAGLYDRPSGLAGVGGKLIAQWLDVVLPEHAHLMCSGRLTVLLSVFCGWRRGLRVERVNRFRTRRKLIECLMGSIHLPWFLDGKPFRRIVINGKAIQVCDGSAAKTIKMWRERGVTEDSTSVRAAHAPHKKPDFFISHYDDQEYVETAPGFMDLCNVEGAVAMVDRGFSYMADKLEKGRAASMAFELSQEELDRWAWFVEAGFGGKETAGEDRPRRASLVDQPRRRSSAAGDPGPSPRHSFM